jgi:hypothetical protein
MAYAPIALFVYKRPEHTRRTIEALKRCPEFAQSPVFVFCDGPRQAPDKGAVQATRVVVKDLLDGHAMFFEASINRGLAASIMAGVNQVCSEHGCTIVVEDDLTVSEHFLNYMNVALHRYAEDERIMQISGYMHPIRLEARTDAIFLPYTSSLGWATWQRAWTHFDPDMHKYEILSNDPELRREFDLGGSYPYFDMLERQIKGQIDSWAIRWYLSVFFRKGLVLHPVRSLVIHEGFDKDATHGRWAYYGKKSTLPQSKVNVFPAIEIDMKILGQIKRYLRREGFFAMKVLRGIRALISR